MEQNKMKRENKKNLQMSLILIGCFVVVGFIGFILGMAFKDSKTNTTDNSMNNGIQMQETQGDNNVDNQQVENVESTVDQQIEAEEGFAIETAYGNLYYPTKWQNQVRVHPVEGDVYTVQFFGVIEGKAEQHLFDIVFGGTDGFTVGNLTIGDTTVSVNLVFADIALDASWNEEESNTIYAMQEDANYLLGMLEKEVNFEPTA